MSLQNNETIHWIEVKLMHIYIYVFLFVITGFRSTMP